VYDDIASIKITSHDVVYDTVRLCEI